MTRTTRIRFAFAAAVVFVAMALLTQLQAQKPATQAELLLGKALSLEEVSGKLADAIAAYTQVLAAPDATRAEKARAQFRIGACYERLGQSEARKAYEAVVANYGDQREFAAQAKARLGAMSTPADSAGVVAGPSLRQVWTTQGDVSWDRISPDGRTLAGVDDTTGELVVREIGASSSRKLTNIPKDRWWEEYADSPVWSADGRSLAFGWDPGTLPQNAGLLLRVADASTGAIRIVPVDSRFVFSWSLDWSPDGKRVLARLQDRTGTERPHHLGWITLTDGTVQTLVTSAGSTTSNYSAFASPDGRWVAYTQSDVAGRDEEEIMLMASSGGPATAVASVTLGRLVGWTPDGRSVLFVAHGSGSAELLAVAVRDGKADGPPMSIRTMPGVFFSLGLTRAGALYYRASQWSKLDLYRADFDPATLRVGRPELLSMPTFDQHGAAGWSPDGRRLAFVGQRFRKAPQSVSIWSADTGQTKTFTTGSNLSRWLPLTWSADGRWVFVAGLAQGPTGFYRVNAETGAVETVLAPDSGVFPKIDHGKTYSSLVGWTPDGTTLFKRVNFKQDGQMVTTTLMAHDVRDHAERELYRSAGPGGVGNVAVSSDGSRVAFVANDFSPEFKSRLLLANTAGGPVTTLADIQRDRGSINGLAWSPNAAFLIYGQRANSRTQPYTIDIETGAVQAFTLGPALVDQMMLSPSGREIAYVGSAPAKDDGVWVLENFLPPAAKASAAPAKPAKK